MAKLNLLILSNVKSCNINIFLTLILLLSFNTIINANNDIIDINCLKKSNVPRDSVFTIVIDPGHGGKDKGTSFKNLWEKNITLNIAKKVKNQLEASFENIKIVLTRNDDSFVPLYERVRMANRLKADVFISIHCNSYPDNPHISGNEVYVLGLTESEENLDVAMRENASVLLEGDYENNYEWFDPNSIEAHIFLSAFQNMFMEQSVSLANMITANIEKQSSIKSRGVKQAGFVILKYATMPSILIEAGFVSNKMDRAEMQNVSGQDKIAKSIADAVSVYLQTYIQ